MREFYKHIDTQAITPPPWLLGKNYHPFYFDFFFICYTRLHHVG